MTHRWPPLPVGFVLLCATALAVGCGNVQGTSDGGSGGGAGNGNGGSGTAGTSGAAGTTGAAGATGAAGTMGTGGTTGAAGAPGGRGGAGGGAGGPGRGGAGGGTGGRGGTTGGTGGTGGTDGGVRCGMATCAAGQVCCNASCGICTPPGGGCIQIACNDLRWYYTCGQRICDINQPPRPDAASSLPPCTPDQKANAACPTLGLTCDPRDNACDRMLECATSPVACPG